MSKIEIRVLFKKMQKDDKKEVLHFEITGDETPHAQTLIEMAGNMTILSVEVGAHETEEIAAEFATLQRDSKKAVLKFNIKGDSQKQAIELYKLAGMNVTLRLQPSQMSIDEFYEEPAGLEYNVNGDGTVEVDKDQLTIDEVAAGEAKVADLEAERQKREVGDDDELPF